MKNKVVLCRTRLEEAASYLRELIPPAHENSASSLRIATALTHVEKAIDILRPTPD